MTLVIQQTRQCDGACCKASPRWPNMEGDDCIYRTNPDPSKGCACRNPGFDLNSLPVSKRMPDISGKECFELTCLNWPQNKDQPYLGATGGECCLQWVEEE